MDQKEKGLITDEEIKSIESNAIFEVDEKNAEARSLTGGAAAGGAAGSAGGAAAGAAGK